VERIFAREKDWEQEYAAWRESKGITNRNYDLHKRQGAPRMPEGADSPRRPASLANGMISPVDANLANKERLPASPFEIEIAR